MNRQKVLDMYFLAARNQLIELAAFMDRLDRADGPGDFRIHQLHKALEKLHTSKGSRARAILLALSDPTRAPAAKAGTKGACGAWAKSVATARQPRKERHS